MADHSKPTVTSLYSNFVAELDARLDDLALMLDPARTTTSNIPTGAIRWASASSKWQLWNGSAWVDLAATYAINALTASSAAKWTTARTLSLSGDVTGSASVDGSANATISATLSNTGVAAGTYKSVTVDAKGRVTGATNPTTLAGYGITDAVPAADVAQVPAASKIVKATADGPIDLGWLDTAVARELRMLAVGTNPSLDLDFGRQNYRRQNGAKGLETLADPFSSFITFTRSTTASYIGADGLLKTAAINEPRIEYDPITGECKGLLIEEQRANVLLNSDAPSTQNVTVTAQAYTVSFYGSGSIAISGAFVGTLAGDGDFPARASLTFTPTAGSISLTISGTVQFAQLEAGSFPTSYIKTEASAVTRGADNASVTGANFSSWYRQDEGTVGVDFSVFTQDGSGAVFFMSDGTNLNRIYCQRSVGGAARNRYITNSNGAGSYSPLRSLVKDTQYRNFLGYKPFNTVASYDGSGIVTLDPSIDSPHGINTLYFGVDGTFYLNGHISRLTYWPKRLTNTQLQELSK